MEIQKISAAIQLLRPKQWIKNLVVFLPFIFSGQFLLGINYQQVVLLFICFCLISSAMYCLNDILDIQEDKNHPKKKFRPIASGILSKND
jgi:4-hydroxybenzoate polyprenyltransferase